MNSDLPTSAGPRLPISAPELAELEAFLRSPAAGPGALDPCALQGLAAALVLSPEMVLPSRWMARVWDPLQGREGPAFDSLAHANRIMALVMQIHNGVAGSLGPAGDGDFRPLFLDPAHWSTTQFCRGLHAGMALQPRPWKQLTGAAGEWLRTLQASSPDAEALVSALMALRRHWHPQAAVSGRDWDSLRPFFEAFRRPFPYAAVERALPERAALAPRFVQVLADLARDPTPALEDPDYMLHHFALVFLAVWRDTRAYRPLLQLLRRPYDEIDTLWGDSLFETVGRALASVCDGDVVPLHELVCDESVSVWVRMTVLDAWMLRVQMGDAPAGPLEDCILELGQREVARLTGKPRSPADDPALLDDLASAVCDLPTPRLVEAARGWFGAGLVDEKTIDRPFFEREVMRPESERRADWDRPRKGYLDDVAQEIAWWAAYQEEEEPEPEVPRTIVRAAPKVGRNDPCPCGSGRKYKRCHGMS